MQPLYLPKIIMTLKENFRGVFVPMVSPLNDDYTIDKKAVGTIIHSFLETNVKPFVLGTTGEAPSLSTTQKHNLVKYTVEAVNGKQPVLAGIGSNSLLTAIEDAKRYSDEGVDALVATVPNYYPSGDVQILNWFEKLADAVRKPLFLYNIPVTTNHSIALDTVEKLSHHPNIIGLKDSENNAQRLKESLKRWKDREDFVFLVGWAAMSAFGVSNGANGIVPSMGNLIPDFYEKLFVEAHNGNLSTAEEIQEQTNIISEYCQKGRDISHSIPALKVLMSIKGLCSARVMPPMMQMEEREEDQYRAQMKNAIENINLFV